jgi:hypothetical protein
MQKSRTPWLAILVTAASIGYATPAGADPIVITGGTVAVVSGIDLPGFTLTGTDSSFTGILPVLGLNCCQLSVGDVFQLEQHALALGSLAGQPTAQVVNGTSYPSAFLNGRITFTTDPFTVPPAPGSTFSFTTPFVASGRVEGFGDFARTIPLFSVDLAGSGTATVSGRPISPTLLLGQSLSFTFTSDAPAPTPEPVSALLLATGVACVMIWRRQAT